MSDRPGLTDEALVEQAQAAPEGDLRAFEALVRRYQEKTVTNCRYLTRQPNEAEDLAQEVFLKAFYGLRRFEGRSSFHTWLKRIKVNHCLNHLRKVEGKTHVALADAEAAEADVLGVEPAAPRNLGAEDERARIGVALDGMSDTLRVPLLLRDLDGLSYQEIADLLGVGLSAVKMRIKRAREEFRRSYGEQTDPAASAPAAP